MLYLGDTGAVFRWATPADPLHQICRDAVESLNGQGATIFITSQVLVEFWALATRPIEANGLGLPIEEVLSTVTTILQHFVLLPEVENIFPTWLKLARRHSIVGRQVYDTRLVAVMQVYGLTHILTLNTRHFHRFPEITAVDPHEVVSS